MPLHDILAELGIGKMASAEEIRAIPHEKFEKAATAIIGRIRAAERAEQQKKPS